MKLTQHQLMIYTNDDYRENVLKSYNAKEEISKIMEELMENKK